MARVATIRNSALYDAQNNLITSEWTQRDGVFASFYIVSPDGQEWKVRPKRLSTATLEITGSRGGASAQRLIATGTRDLRKIFVGSAIDGSNADALIAQTRLVDGELQIDVPEQGRVLEHGSASAHGDTKTGDLPIELQAACFAIWAVDGPRSPSTRQIRH